MSIPFHAHGWPDILPVRYFHQVFALPAPVADIAYQNKTVIYDLLFKASALPIMRPALWSLRNEKRACIAARGFLLQVHSHLAMLIKKATAGIKIPVIIGR
jgi:hypothetical protein